MKPGLRMMMMQGDQDNRRRNSDDPNRRRIGFGANDDDERREPSADDSMRSARYDAARRRENETRRTNGESDRYESRRNNVGEYRRMMEDEDFMQDEPEMRRRRDERGRYMGDDRQEMNYPSNITPMRPMWPQRSQMHEQREQPVRAGGTFWMMPPDGEEKKLTREKAEHWVRKMSRQGEAWTFEDAKRLGEECGVGDDKQSQIDFFAALNMVKSDYGKVARKYGIDDERFYADLAMAFLHDEDGKRPSEKLAAYYKAVVPHDED